MRFRLLAPVSALVFLFAVAEPVEAQACGPFNISTAVTGPGCVPFGGGTPLLTAGLGLSPAGVCRIPFTLQMQLNLFAQQRPVLLAMGLTNPALPLGGFGLSGCTLWAAPAAVAPMVAAGSNYLIYVHTLQVPHSPALVGTTVFAQGLTLPNANPGTTLAFSNGLSVSL